MSGRIQTPTNQKLLTNVAVVRYKKCGKRFEIACYKNKVLNWRNKVEKNIDEVLQTPTVFTNVSKGQVAKKDELVKIFETDDMLEICKIKGDLQVSDKERAAQTNSAYKELANLISNMCVNPETNRPYSVNVIEKGLKDVHIAIKPNKSVKQQALEIIPKLKESLKIDRAQMRVRCAITAKEAKKLHKQIKDMFGTVEMEDWEDGTGNLEIVGLIEPGMFKTIENFIKKEVKEGGELELLSLKVVNDGDIEIK
ncbi:Ribosome maturation protein SBDS [Strongyloides ratti]|uniref:Ribosome maturation protein SBDS n=1 Tax=Strongyloides ratti TaxID=34506 RepID=A0A090LE22_STRRB|nr:Ribosome maturation protein SBDS [Strongyloides ratti]CEF65720.1 Ribosome maturation protein SBDS [Strongyloides ratti]